VTLAFAAFAAIMALVNLVALACIDYNLRRGYYRTRSNSSGGSK